MRIARRENAGKMMSWNDLFRVKKCVNAQDDDGRERKKREEERERERRGEERDWRE